MRVLSIETPTHGRVLIEDAADSFSGRVLVAFHGYGQSADDMLDEVRRIPGAGRWRLVSVQGLHRFYTRRDQAVVASWMTRQDREHAIADNIEYVNRVDRPGRRRRQGARLCRVLAGRRDGLSRRDARAAIRPPASWRWPETSHQSSRPRRASRTWPRVLIGVGTREEWYTPERLEADVAFLRASGVTHDVVRFDGGHEWTDEFRAAAGRWLERF